MIGASVTLFVCWMEFKSRTSFCYSVVLRAPLFARAGGLHVYTKKEERRASGTDTQTDGGYGTRFVSARTFGYRIKYVRLVLVLGREEQLGDEDARIGAALLHDTRENIGIVKGAEE